MTDDLVVRLLEAIQERERPELAARGDHNLAWTMAGDNADQVQARCLYCDWTIEGLENEVDPQADEHARCCAGMPPAEVLRLCHAHRKIVEAYDGARFTQECHPEHEGNNGYVAALVEVLGWLAEGYGIEAKP